MVSSVPLKVLMIAPTPFFADRGCHVRIYEEIRALQAHGCEIVLCTYHLGKEMEGVKTERIMNIPWYSKLEAGPSWQKPFLDILLLVKSFMVIRRFRPRVIHAHLHEGAFVGRFLSRWFNLPLVFDYQGSMTAEMADHEFLRTGGLFFKILKGLEGWINNGAEIIVTSSGGGKELLESGFGVQGDKVIPVLDGVDTETFRPGLAVDDLKRRHSIPDGKRLVLYLGLLNEYQGVDLLLESAATVLQKKGDVHFVLMGYPNVERYREVASRLGIGVDVTFTGRINYEEAPRYLCMGDIAVSAKLSGTEANGKLYNYAAASLPTVCFDTPVNREILGDSGVYAELGNRKALADAIVDLLSNEERLLELKKAVRKRAEEELSWKSSAKKIMSVYEEVLCQKR